MEGGFEFNTLHGILSAVIVFGGAAFGWSRIKTAILEAPLKRQELENKVENNIKEIEYVKGKLEKFDNWKTNHNEEDSKMHGEIKESLHAMDKKIEKLTGVVETLGRELLQKEISKKEAD